MTFSRHSGRCALDAWNSSWVSRRWYDLTFVSAVCRFQGLIQREWVSAGHPFSERCSHLLPPPNRSAEDYKNPLSCPVFLLFLDCVWQVSLVLIPIHAPLLCLPLNPPLLLGFSDKDSSFALHPVFSCFISTTVMVSYSVYSGSSFIGANSATLLEHADGLAL